MTEDAPPFVVLKDLRERSGHTYRSLAQATGYRSGSGVQTLERPDRGHKPFNLPTVRKLAKTFHGKGDPPITAQDIAQLLGQPSLPFSTPEQKAILYDLLDLPLPEEVRAVVSVIPGPVHLMPVVGQVQASFWMIGRPSIDVPEAHIAIPFVSDIPVSEQYALKVVGPSMNKVAPEGTYAICSRYGGSPRQAKNGAIVHVERQRFGEVEWTLKRVRYDHEGAHLCPESYDPAYQTPIPLLEGDNEGTVRILGIAEGFYTKLKNR